MSRNVTESGAEFFAFADYTASREHVIIGCNASAFIGSVDAWAGSLYWPVRDENFKLVAYVRREAGGLYHPDADKSPAIQWAAECLMGLREPSQNCDAPRGALTASSVR